MAEFSVELVGGPYAGRRSLKSRRRQPPEEIPILLGTDPPREEEAGADRSRSKMFAVYRYSHRDTDTETLVYSYTREREAPGRPGEFSP